MLYKIAKIKITIVEICIVTIFSYNIAIGIHSRIPKMEKNRMFTNEGRALSFLLGLDRNLPRSSIIKVHKEYNIYLINGYYVIHYFAKDKSKTWEQIRYSWPVVAGKSGRFIGNLNNAELL